MHSEYYLNYCVKTNWLIRGKKSFILWRGEHFDDYFQIGPSGKDFSIQTIQFGMTTRPDIWIRKV